MLTAQPEPFWTHLPVSPCLIDWGKIMHPTYPTNVLTLSEIVDECKPLHLGVAPVPGTRHLPPGDTGLVGRRHVLRVGQR
jgi:hypothetical protein